MRIIGIDPGNEVSGVCGIEDGKIVHASNEKNNSVFAAIKKIGGAAAVSVVIEDLQPYLMRMSQQVINTAKFIGELTYRFNTCDFVKNIKLVPRNTVKKWIFDCCPEIVLPRIEKKMHMIDKRKTSKGQKGLRKNDGEMRLPSFHYVDDRIVIAVLKELYSIPTPKPGKPNIYGLKDHSWQALAVAAKIESSRQ